MGICACEYKREAHVLLNRFFLECVAHITRDETNKIKRAREKREEDATMIKKKRRRQE